MILFKKTHSQTYAYQGKKGEEVPSESNLAAGPNPTLNTLKEIIKQTTLKQSNKIDDKKSGHPLHMFKNVLRRSISKKEVVCHICQEFYALGQTSKLASCEHNFCKSCINKYLMYKINVGQEVKCPEGNCIASFSKQSQLFVQLPIELRNKFLKTEKFLLTMKNPNIKQCLQSNCDGLFDISKTPCVCTTCEVAYCPKCSYKFHEGECQDFHVQFLQNQFHFRKCNKCGNVIQKNQGCNHITCLCGHQFCYLCGANWEIDPCRYNGNPPAPPAPPRPCFVNAMIITMKVLLIGMYALVAAPLYALAVILIVVASIAISVVIGGFRLAIECEMNCFFKILMIPLVLMGGIFWYFFDNLDVTCDFVANLTSGSLWVIQRICDLCDN